MKSQVQSQSVFALDAFTRKVDETLAATIKQAMIDWDKIPNEPHVATVPVFPAKKKAVHHTESNSPVSARSLVSGFLLSYFE